MIIELEPIAFSTSTELIIVAISVAIIVASIVALAGFVAYLRARYLNVWKRGGKLS